MSDSQAPSNIINREERKRRKMEEREGWRIAREEGITCVSSNDVYVMMP